MSTDTETKLDTEPEIDPVLRSLQRKIAEVVSVLSIEIIDDKWLTGSPASRSQKKHDILMEAMQLAKSLESKLTK